MCVRGRGEEEKNAGVTGELRGEGQRCGGRTDSWREGGSGRCGGRGGEGAVGAETEKKRGQL